MTHINFDSGLIFHGSLSGGYPPEPVPPVDVDNIIITGGLFDTSPGQTNVYIGFYKIRGSYNFVDAKQISIDIKSQSAALEKLALYTGSVSNVANYIGDSSSLGYNNPSTAAVTDFKVRYNLLDAAGKIIATSGFVDLTKGV